MTAENSRFCRLYRATEDQEAEKMDESAFDPSIVLFFQFSLSSEYSLRQSRFLFRVMVDTSQ